MGVSQQKQGSLFPLYPSFDSRGPRTGIEGRFDVPFVASLALREKQV